MSMFEFLAIDSSVSIESPFVGMFYNSARVLKQYPSEDEYPPTFYIGLDKENIDFASLMDSVLGNNVNRLVSKDLASYHPNGSVFRIDRNISKKWIMPPDELSFFKLNKENKASFVTRLVKFIFHLDIRMCYHFAVCTQDVIAVLGKSIYDLSNRKSIDEVIDGIKTERDLDKFKRPLLKIVDFEVLK